MDPRQRLSIVPRRVEAIKECSLRFYMLQGKPEQDPHVRAQASWCAVVGVIVGATRRQFPGDISLLPRLPRLLPVHILSLGPCVRSALSPHSWTKTPEKKPCQHLAIRANHGSCARAVSSCRYSYCMRQPAGWREFWGDFFTFHFSLSGE